LRYSADELKKIVVSLQCIFLEGGNLKLNLDIRTRQLLSHQDRRGVRLSFYVRKPVCDPYKYHSSKTHPHQLLYNLVYKPGNVLREFAENKVICPRAGLLKILFPLTDSFTLYHEVE